MNDTLNNGNRYNETTTARFTPVNTGEIVGRLATEGWEVNRTNITRTRDANRQPYARHLVTLRQTADRLELANQAHQVGDLIRELRMMNGNDGSQSVEIMAGYMRLICLNGVTVGHSFVSYKIKHSTRPEQMKELLGLALESVGEQFAHGETAIQNWKRILLDDKQMRSLAAFAITNRFQKLFTAETLNGDIVTLDYLRREYAARVDSILQPRRSEDKPNDLWTVFNRIQENIVRGGWTGTTPRVDGDGIVTLGTRKIRGVSNVKDSVSLNRALWDAAETVARGETLATVPELLA